MNKTYTITPLNESTALVSFGNIIDEAANRKVISLHEFLNRKPFNGFVESVPAYSSLAIFYNAIEVIKNNTKSNSSFEFVKNYIENALTNLPRAEALKENQVIEIPVLYDGEDLQFVADVHRLTLDEVIAIHTSKTYRVFMVGFLPGFPYMGTVDERVATPRKNSPRTSVPAGSVGIAGYQTGIYPQDSPGGWQLIGRTPFKIFAKDKSNPCLLNPGDSIRFYAVDQKNLKASMSIEVIKPGLLSALVASERTGFRYLGVGPGGAMDSFAMKTANYLVGNDDAATIEINFPAPELLLREDHLVSVTGSGFRININNEIFSPWKPILVKKGAAVRFEKVEAGSRAYLAVHGGWKAQEWLGSFTTHLGVKAGGHLGRPLQKGDILEANGFLQQVNETKTLPWGISKNELDKIYWPSNEIRIAASVEAELLSKESKESLLTTEFSITSRSNRMGYRLEGEKLFLNRSLELVSSPVDFGTIQLLPDGNLIILMADHQTTGGYPRIASVIKSDLPKLAQKSVSDKIKFILISLNEAENELQYREKLLTELKQACLTQCKNYFKI